MQLHPRSSLSRSLLCFSMLMAVLLAGAAPASAQDGPATSSTTTTSGEAPAADALPKEFRFEFGLTGGAHFCTREHGLGRNEGDVEEMSPYHGGAFGGRLALNFNRFVSIEGEALGIPTRTINDTTKMWVFAYRGSLIVHFAGQGSAFRPFISIGYGALSSVVNSPRMVTGDPATDVPGGDTDGMVHGGLGFKIAFGDYVGLRIEGRVLAPPAFAADVIPVGDELGYGGPDFEALGGLFVNFGEVERAIYKKEVVVQQPPPAPPSPDPDGDGILGKADKCPTNPEDKDGFEDEDGCPELDNDQDGVPDETDKCPMVPEDKDGFEDDDGCPDPDNDKDGFLDGVDKCPNDPEVFNGFEDDDGCPDKGPALAVLTDQQIEIKQQVNFATDKSTIKKNSFTLLATVARIMKLHPEITKVRVEGHTDNHGTEKHNLKLSQDRADSVRKHLIEVDGIDAD